MASIIPDSDPLQQPFSLSPSLKLSHRVVLAPMTRMRASDSGVPHPRTKEYYAARATPGGLLISEGIVINPRGRGFPNTPGLYTDEQVEAWKEVNAGVRKKGGLMFAQLWHTGRISVPSQTGGFPPFSSTKTPLPGNHPLFGQENGTEPYVENEVLSLTGISEVISQFAHAARNAIHAGFAGIEIHGGNGYLLDQFVHDNINDRTDEYGGNLENRLRFPLEVVDAIVREIGRERVGIRVAPFHVLQQTRDSRRMETFGRYVGELEKRGLAYVHLVEPRYDQLSSEGAFASERNERDVVKEEHKNEDLSIWPFRRLLKKIPVIGAGGYDGASAREAISEGRVDLVAFGRTFTSNPELPKMLFEATPLKKYERATFYTPGMEGYLDP
ncbi:related to Putative 12-oxophytodienoate reductase 2 [Phialocephala subalpina]|uniref:Related to Putative 12-oxophytodienoate reductase 2 n=1 Tax=Phialocephala subalpina TaxID=576137 RepID=A0A1L7X574_9HELO|nr:related to Putative 12-oxophytodienoate reductase 2 [Phialocephala subalpina]